MSTYKTILEPATMQYAKPLAFPQAAFCEQIINIGLFFDGTDNKLRLRAARHHSVPAQPASGQPHSTPCQEAA
ncbi:hypothetical protein ABIC63_004488 [Pseudacidovorax sp. 1753]|uniref:hypothetical protein n=1 Tax=unclassified Pseudacidovorax TaxID=2620592 RepID=UPI001B51F2FE|nr:hypothetical protein [Pseudacidovorax sp.]MBP6897071.1 hypothetical protein [Pseudacidovorax sp.]